MISNIKRHILKSSSYLVAKAGLSDRMMVGRDTVPQSIISTIQNGGRFPMPEDVQFEITMRCNLNCSMCHQKQRRSDSQGDLATADILKIIDNLKGARIRRVKLIGGEIFLRKDILEIISCLNRRQIGVSITTNGTLLNESILSGLGRCPNLLGMVFSIDGMEAEHDRIRRLDGCFRRTVQNMRAAASFLPLTKVTCVLQEDNLKDVEQMIANAKEWKAGIMAFLLESFSTEQDIEATKSMLHGFGSVEFFLSASTRDHYGFVSEELVDVSRRIKRAAVKTGVISYLGPPAAALHPQSFHAGNILTQENKATCGYLNKLIITESGDVLACPFINIQFGNLLQQGIEEIWNSEKIRTYRELFVTSGPFPICRRCCALTVVR